MPLSLARLSGGTGTEQPQPCSQRGQGTGRLHGDVAHSLRGNWGSGRGGAPSQWSVATLPDTWCPPTCPPAAVLAGPASCRPVSHRAEGTALLAREPGASPRTPEPWAQSPAGSLTCTSGPLAFMLVVMWLLIGRCPQAARLVVWAPDGVWLCWCHCPGLRLPGADVATTVRGQVAAGAMRSRQGDTRPTSPEECQYRHACGS